MKDLITLLEILVSNECAFKTINQHCIKYARMRMKMEKYESEKTRIQRLI